MDANSVTIVTGGGRGIGRTVALRMAKETVVMVVSQHQQNTMATVREIHEAGGIAKFTIGDVAEAHTAWECELSCRGLKISNLICNAGIGIGGPTEEFSHANWKRMFDVNVHGAFYFIRTFLPMLIENGGGNIILMSSTAGLDGLQRNMAYSATKHALVGMAKSLGLEYARHGIRCVAICPNFVEGGMTESLIKNLAMHRKISEADALQIVIDSTPKKRLITQAEIAAAVAKICTNRFFCPGNILVINGEKP